MVSSARMHGTAHRYRIPVFLFFFCSGAAGLILEVVWTRILGTVFGNTVFAASTVLTAFMLGLALGSAVLGRVAERVKRPLLLYGCLELGVAFFALIFPLLTAASYVVYRWFFRAFDPSFGAICAVRFVLSLLILLPPCFLMGGTLPVLGHFLASRRREPERVVGYLYAINTFGAVTGCFVAGFVLIEMLGVRGSLFAAAGIALSIGLLAVALGARPEQTKRRVRKKKKEIKKIEAEAPVAEPLPASTYRLLLVAFALAGFCSLAYEVLWTRILIFVLTTSTYSFSIMLTTFLVGIAVGSLFSTRLVVPRISRPLLWFGIVEVAVGLTSLVSVAVLSDLEAIDYSFLNRFAGTGGLQVLLARFADAFCVLFVPTFLMGAAFPIVLKACLGDRERVGRHVGRLYAANTIGCVFGSFAAGFVLLPLIGTHRSLVFVVGLNFAVGIALVWKAGARSGAVRYGLASALAGACVVALALIPSDIFYRTINTYHHPSKITYMHESPTGTVTVHEFATGERLLAVDGVDVAGDNFMLRSTQKLQGYIPLILHPAPQKVVQIGFGSGETARVGIEFGVKDYTVVEISPAVLVADRHFEDINHGSFEDERIRWVFMDGKNFALLTDEKFDIVMNDSIYPGSSGSSALYTVDHFRRCRERLAEGGLFSCWVPIDLRPSELRMILRSFQEVFPHTSFWIASNCLNKHALILGTLEPLKIDYQHVARVMSRPDVAADLQEIAIESAFDFIESFMCDEDTIRKLVRNDPLNSDDRPRLEISCAVPEASELKLAQALSQFAQNRAPFSPYVVNLPDKARTLEEMARRFRATTFIFQAHVAQLLGFPEERCRRLELALQEIPGERHVESCQEELRLEVRDLRGALSANKMAGNPVLMARLADKLSMLAYVPLKGVDRALAREAASLYGEMIGQSPRQAPAIYVRLTSLYLALNDFDSAKRVARQCLSVWPNSHQGHALMAQVHFQTGRRDLALQSIERALQLAPGNPLYEARRRELLDAGNPARSVPGPAHTRP